MDHYDFCSQHIKPGSEVLDVGAGKGSFLCEMAKRGFRVYGVEINSAYIKQIKQKAHNSGLDVLVTQCRAEKLPYVDNKFDFINSSEVTEHVDDPEAVCREIYRVMRSGASGYISFHNRFGVYDYHYHMYFINWLPRLLTEPILKILKRQKSDGVAGRQKLTTMHYYTFSQVKKFLSSFGFEVEDIRVGKIKSRFGSLAVFLLPFYWLLLRPLYFNSFHVLVRKNT